MSESAMPDYAPCPVCFETTAQPIAFTWWGGLLGPKLLTHVRCSRCGTRYNGKTGWWNTTGIAIYVFVVGLIFFVVAYYLASLLFGNYWQLFVP